MLKEDGGVAEEDNSFSYSCIRKGPATGLLLYIKAINNHTFAANSYKYEKTICIAGSLRFGDNSL